jgi:hypothetical protein
MIVFVAIYREISTNPPTQLPQKTQNDPPSHTPQHIRKIGVMVYEIESHWG